MAAENKVYLNGLVHGIKGIRRDSDGGAIAEIWIYLCVKRRTQKIVENDARKKIVRYDDILVRVKKEDLIRYIQEHKVAAGDTMAVVGTLVSERVEKKFECRKCHTANFFSGILSYVYPMSICMTQIRPKTKEIIRLTNAEIAQGGEAVRKILDEKKHTDGTIIFTEIEGSDENGTDAMVLVQPEYDDADAVQYLSEVEEMSNVIHVMGNLCEEPVFTKDSRTGSNCKYQLGVNRKLFIKEDDPGNYTDYPIIHSLGKQAEKDMQFLKTGSLVNIEGALQERDGFKIKKRCRACGEENRLNSSAIEIVPYSVEYAKDCLNSDGEEEEEEQKKDARLEVGWTETEAVKEKPEAGTESDEDPASEGGYPEEDGSEDSGQGSEETADDGTVYADDDSFDF